DGVHFDYIRYDGVNGCFCDCCRERFEKSLGRKVENWPEDVMQDGKLWSEYSAWRAGLITHIVKTVHDEMKVRHPNVKISAAVFNTYPHCKEVYGQDWVKWANEGFVDFLCPMNYTQKTETFENMTRSQQALVRPDFPLYFGIGEYKLTADGTLDQVKSAKKLGGKGFTIYNLEPSAARKILPPLTK
ncbi:MAG: family 10 glycosylhydrolase, partial [Thermoguttaceae bacterium]|nr:family 10 glycosylhydrolase [Thermoguttaceae bacterium]